MDKWNVGIILLVMGMLMCFIVLGLLAIIIRVTNRLFPYKVPVAGTVPPERVQPAAPITDIAPAASVAIAMENQAVPAPVVAAIITALACATEKKPGWQVTGVRRVGRETQSIPAITSNWARFGRFQLLGGRNKCVDREGSWRK